MSSVDNIADFYPPDAKELGLGICYVLDQAGGQLSLERVAEVLGDFLDIPEKARNQLRADQPNTTEWIYYLRWACSELRGSGFLSRNDSGNWGMCVLTEHGRELGQWAAEIYGGDRPVLPDWAEAFIQPIATRIKNLLMGGKRRKPPDYELCRWVRYCYLLDWPDHGVAVFSRVLADSVEPAVYRKAERQARILRVRVKEKPREPREALPVVSKKLPSAPSLLHLHDWIMEQFPRGTKIPTLVRAGHNEIRNYDVRGVTIVPSRTGGTQLVSWGLVDGAYRKLASTGWVTQETLGFRGNFLCALLALFPGTKRVPGECAVRLVGDLPSAIDAAMGAAVIDDATTVVSVPATSDDLSLERRACPRCGSTLRRARGPIRAFIGCSRYPACTYTEDLPKPTSHASSMGSRSSNGT